MNHHQTVLVLDFGRMIAEGTPSEVSNNPDVIAAYLGEEFEAADLGDSGSSEEE